MTVLEKKYTGSKAYYRAYSLLLGAAEARGTIEYMPVAEVMGITQTGNYMGKEVGQMCGEISENEVSHGRPMLSAVVVKTDGRPGEGFFTFARQIGRWDGSGDKVDFWRSEIQEVYSTWGTP